MYINLDLNPHVTELVRLCDTRHVLFVSINVLTMHFKWFHVLTCTAQIPIKRLKWWETYITTPMTVASFWNLEHTLSSNAHYIAVIPHLTNPSTKPLLTNAKNKTMTEKFENIISEIKTIIKNSLHVLY